MLMGSSRVSSIRPCWLLAQRCYPGHVGRQSLPAGGSASLVFLVCPFHHSPFAVYGRFRDASTSSVSLAYDSAVGLVQSTRLNDRLRASTQLRPATSVIPALSLGSPSPPFDQIVVSDPSIPPRGSARFGSVDLQ
ncbi:hypothetical protein R1flu_027375 [Riccia fluitans]|uniref:Uncharacterized protein n=1 Tax=Riccia fluitans TaxID=41844 RepID=A0ABD1XIL6_9MARC